MGPRQTRTPPLTQQGQGRVDRSSALLPDGSANLSRSLNGRPSCPGQLTRYVERLPNMAPAECRRDRDARGRPRRANTQSRAAPSLIGHGCTTAIDRGLEVGSATATSRSLELDLRPLRWLPGSRLRRVGDKTVGRAWE